MGEHFFAYLSRMRYITRWGLMRSTVPENVQEHSHMTAVLAHALAVIRRDVLGGEADPERAATAALFHDAGEILTGDLPTPVKYFSPTLRSSYREVEDLAAEKLLSTLPEAMRPAYAPWLQEDYDRETWSLVKAADKLSAHIQCLEELKAGNPEFRKAAQQTKAALLDMELPEVAYFMEHFLPAFQLTLDELE
ncbi:MAG TPA: 5'-deoxynucleotidase [Candidatus Flavonifractor merdigallinarum]|uniref:5'-deoxynucleotidase n=1 Tax=Candidatus Flavonifractor merdigallinarum TaxID=2838589 RepID=A0A9D1Y730_9FIRM|nr:5'-deoxynucleotidase [Candidatus Flavonifractor merdigallinarum]